METKKMLRELRATQKKEECKKVDTFETNWWVLLDDVIKKIEEQERECLFWKDEYECGYKAREQLTETLLEVKDRIDSTWLYEDEKKTYVERR